MISSKEIWLINTTVKATQSMASSIQIFARIISLEIFAIHHWKLKGKKKQNKKTWRQQIA